MEPDVQVYTRSDCGPLWLQPCLPFSDIVGWFETHRGCIYFIQFTWTFDNLMNLRPPYNYSANYSANVNRNLSPDSEFWPGWPIIRWPFVHDLVWPSVTLPVWPSIIWDLIWKLDKHHHPELRHLHDVVCGELRVTVCFGRRVVWASCICSCECSADVIISERLFHGNELLEEWQNISSRCNFM